MPKPGVAFDPMSYMCGVRCVATKSSFTIVCTVRIMSRVKVYNKSNNKSPAPAHQSVSQSVNHTLLHPLA